jgi:hypothetical protein
LYPIYKDINILQFKSIEELNYHVDNKLKNGYINISKDFWDQLNQCEEMERVILEVDLEHVFDLMPLGDQVLLQLHRNNASSVFGKQLIQDRLLVVVNDIIFSTIGVEINKLEEKILKIL